MLYVITVGEKDFENLFDNKMGKTKAGDGLRISVPMREHCLKILNYKKRRGPMPVDIVNEVKKLEDKKEEWRNAVSSSREMILSKICFFPQIPAPTFEEKNRSELIIERFSECGVAEPETDEMYNGCGMLYGTTGERNILITTHMDNNFDQFVDQNISITEHRIFGAGTPEDNLALAVLCTLHDIFSRADFKLKSNISLLATTRFNGRGDFSGIRHYMKNCRKRPDYVINLSGITLGQLDYFTLSRIRCDITVERGNFYESPWLSGSGNSTIIVANEIINSILRIPLPRKPKSLINIGMIKGGERFSTISRQTVFRLEVLSEDDSITDSVIGNIQDNCTDIGAKFGADVKLEFFGRHHAKGLTCSHPMIKCAAEIINSIGSRPTMNFINSEISVALAEGIPSLNLGLTTGEGGLGGKSYIDIKPIKDGIVQLMMLINLIDNGICDE